MISAMHINADALVHFGHACLFPAYKAEAESTLKRNVEILMIYCQYSLDINRLISSYIDPVIKDEPGSKVYLISDVIYHSFITEHVDQFHGKAILGRPVIHEKYSSDKENLLFCNDLSSNHVHICRRCFGLEKMLEAPVIIYVGKHHSPEMREVLLTFMHSAKRLVVFDPTSAGPSDQPEVTRELNRSLGKRLFFAEKVRDARSVGLVVSASSAAAVVTQTALSYAKTLLKNVGKRVYVFCIGTLTPTKLAAYTEIDCFVFLGCPERALQVNSTDFYKPVVSFAEMEMACSQSRALHYRFVPDLTDLLPEGSCYIPQEAMDVDKVDVSLIGNNARSMVQENGNDLLAGERLVQRQWIGLTKADAENSKTITTGRKGIPIRYEEEVQ